jgi:protoporphyrinogen oxidase
MTLGTTVVVGGGFRGILAAYLLRKEGAPVILLERSGHLGGVLHSEQWEGLYLDKGCHLFSNDKNKTTKIMLEIMSDEIIPVDVSYASILNGAKTEGFAIPDISALGEEIQQRVLFETIEAATENANEPTSFFEKLVQQFGPTAAKILSGAVKKNYGLNSKYLDAAIFPISLFNRLRIVPDDMANILKNVPELDRRIVATGHGGYFDLRDQGLINWPHHNFYPAHHGMNGFCEAADRTLKDIGVEIMLEISIENITCYDDRVSLNLSDGSEIEADKIFWALESDPLARLIFGEEPISPYVNNVPMVLFYFLVPPSEVGSYTYVHDFSENSQIFRASAPGVYGQQTSPDGLTYVCFEVTTKIGSALWNDPESKLKAIWDEGVDMGMVSGDLPTKSKILKTPVSYKGPKVGFVKEQKKFMKCIQELSNRIILPDQTSFGKNDIFDDLQSNLLHTA